MMEYTFWMTIHKKGLFLSIPPTIIGIHPSGLRKLNYIYIVCIMLIVNGDLPNL